jgi:hypothetical protein
MAPARSYPSTDTGNSSGPPATVPPYVAVLVTSSVSQLGSVAAGTVSEIVVVSTNPGYLNDPGGSGVRDGGRDPLS